MKNMTCKNPQDSSSLSLQIKASTKAKTIKKKNLLKIFIFVQLYLMNLRKLLSAIKNIFLTNMSSEKTYLTKVNLVLDYIDYCSLSLMPAFFFNWKKIRWEERKPFIYLVSLCSFLKLQLIRISFIANRSQIHGPSDPIIISVSEISWLTKHSPGEAGFQTKTTQSEKTLSHIK